MCSHRHKIKCWVIPLAPSENASENWWNHTRIFWHYYHVQKLFAPSNNFYCASNDTVNIGSSKKVPLSALLLYGKLLLYNSADSITSTPTICSIKLQSELLSSLTGVKKEHKSNWGQRVSNHKRFFFPSVKIVTDLFKRIQHSFAHKTAWEVRWMLDPSMPL